MPILAHSIIKTGDNVAHWTCFIHGIFGQGRNWATIARKVTAARPDWGAVLVDLREHGASQGFAGPHTLAAAATDLAQLAQATGVRPDAIVAHSFGGKVALLYARDHADGQRREVWVVDSTPDAGEPSGSAWRMLEILRTMPASFAARADAVAALEAGGVANATAQWMTTNLESHEGAPAAAQSRTYTWRIDFDSMEALLRDFFRTDLWDVVESPPAELSIHFIKAEESSVLNDAACTRIEAAGRATGRVFLHRLPGGHWLNTDNPEGILQLLLG